ncbi:hypothetical protein DQ392_27935 [Streptomyces reniochalinae]|uniref:PPM-type phosphatase domain-containing protein n=1 Tax=Streptomyces reniochalinae TaxID=2250578 RepID=A0A367EAP5_9ACTN|nr:hypothetical protein DQ392_27935 [Streptomyces reniochalinae]
MVEPLLPPAACDTARGGLPEKHSRREIVDAIRYVVDGITEARSRTGQEFGLDRFLAFLTGHIDEGVPLPETLRRLMHSHHGHLCDDATTVLLQWHGPQPFAPP